MTNAYVYRITNTVTQEFYYGYRYRNQKLKLAPSNDLWVGYFTSSKRIKNDIEKYGVHSFIPTILYEDADSVKCWRYEQQLIKNDWCNQKLLNGKFHDPESNVEIYRRINIISDESKQKMSNAGKGRPKSTEHKRKIALANTGNVGSAQKRAKISAARKGKATNKGVSPPKYPCPHCGKYVSNGNLARWHGDNCKAIDQAGHLLRTKQIASLNQKP